MFRILPALLLILWTVDSLPEAVAEDVLYFEQGWDESTRDKFYFTPQGSRLIPVDWFLGLESDDPEVLFSSPENLRKYRVLYPGRASARNPHGLPIGFAVEQAATPCDERWLGLTCAACHTDQFTVEGKPHRVDGGSSNLDFDAFYADLAGAVMKTFNDEARYGRFEERLLPKGSKRQKFNLRSDFASFYSKLRGDAVIRRAGTKSGPGRVDALTQIVNALAVSGQREPSNLVAIHAPTSYPHLWLTPQLEFVQWNPIAASPVARNAGEVLGVFGTANLSGPREKLHRSSVLLRELSALESWVEQLEPPTWKASFGEIDEGRAAEGKSLYDQHCKACHNTRPYEYTAPEENHFGKQFLKIGRVDYRSVGTDPVYVESFVERLVRTNEVMRERYDNEPIVPAVEFFLRSTADVVDRKMNELNLTPEERIVLHGFRLRPPKTPGGKPTPYYPPSFQDLKAGPLVGIWATGPFLHNGSVPTVYDLLSPVDARPDKFWTGGRELDREKLGFVSGNAPGRFPFDTTKSGNGNEGHVYPRQGLDHDQRMAIIEYLKTLK